MSAALKQVNPNFGTDLETVSGEAVPAEATAAASAVDSPAKALQETLAAELGEAGDDKMSARLVTCIVIGACALTWVGGVLLYATL